MAEAITRALDRYGLDVEAVPSAQAVDAARTAAPDLVLLVGHAAKEGGAEVLRRLAAHPGTQVVPVALLADDDALDARLRAFRHGAVAVVPRGASADAVGARVRDLVRELPERSGEASGELGEATLDELVGLLKRELRTGILSVQAPGADPAAGQANTEGSGMFRLVLGPGKPVAAAVEAFVAQLRPLVSKAEPLRYELLEHPGARLGLLDAESEDEAADAEAMQVLRGLRLLLIVPDAVRADALATELRARGALVVVSDTSGQGLDRARALDPEVAVVDAAAVEGPGFAVVKSFRRDPRLRWASMLVAHADELFPGGAASPDVPRLAARLGPLVEPDRQLERRAAAEDRLDTRLELVGPSRLLRAMARVSKTIHITVRNPRAVVEVDLSDGLVVGATARAEAAGPDPLEGAAALAALLALGTGRVRIERRSHPAAANLMLPIDEALASAAAEVPPLPPSLPPPSVVGGLAAAGGVGASLLPPSASVFPGVRSDREAAATQGRDRDPSRQIEASADPFDEAPTRDRPGVADGPRAATAATPQATRPQAAVSSAATPSAAMPAAAVPATGIPPAASPPAEPGSAAGAERRKPAGALPPPPKRPQSLGPGASAGGGRPPPGRPPGPAAVAVGALRPAPKRTLIGLQAPALPPAAPNAMSSTGAAPGPVPGDAVANPAGTAADPGPSAIGASGAAVSTTGDQGAAAEPSSFMVAIEGAFADALAQPPSGPPPGMAPLASVPAPPAVPGVPAEAGPADLGAMRPAGTGVAAVSAAAGDGAADRGSGPGRSTTTEESVSFVLPTPDVALKGATGPFPTEVPGSAGRPGGAGAAPPAEESFVIPDAAAVPTAVREETAPAPAQRRRRPVLLWVGAAALLAAALVGGLAFVVVLPRLRGGTRGSDGAEVPLGEAGSAGGAVGGQPDTRRPAPDPRGGAAGGGAAGGGAAGGGAAGGGAAANGPSGSAMGGGATAGGSLESEAGGGGSAGAGGAGVRAGPSGDEDEEPRVGEQASAADRAVMRGNRLVAQGDLRAGELAYLEALRLEARNPHALSGLARLHMQRGAPRDAVHFAEQAVAARPRRVRYRVQLGDAYALAGRRADAERAYREALRVDPRDREARARLGLR